MEKVLKIWQSEGQANYCSRDLAAVAVAKNIASENCVFSAI